MQDKEIAISVKNIGKKYVIGQERRSNTLRDVMVEKARKFKGGKGASRGKDFWALSDVNFDVYKGETLGIIGGNGAGKSTILKVLSRIIEPTTGHFTVEGRVASLLEVGTGFHPELTGRENVFFNGSVLGMTHREIQQRFDEIVDFAEIQEFIDTPVKFYSSGMYVRLAFAIAAHLDPEVLIIDEALAVGDVAFQQKCVSKMRASADSGKTVIFVSHSMSIIEDLCDRVMYLQKGTVQAIGRPAEVISKYLGTTVENLTTTWDVSSNYAHKDGNPVYPKSMKLLTEDGKPLGAYVVPGENVVVDVEIDIDQPAKDLSVGVSMINEASVRLFRTAVTDPADESKRIPVVQGRNHLQVTLPTADLLDGRYIVALDCDVYRKEWIHNPYFTEMRTRFLVKNDGSSPVLPWGDEREGMLKPYHPWRQLS